MKIEIQADADFTPKGKRTARIVQTSGNFGRGRQIRWYVSGKIYAKMAVTVENAELSNKWLTA